MPLIKCPDCGKEVSDSAPNCPQCGKTISKTETNKEQSNAVARGIIFLLVLGGLWFLYSKISSDFGCDSSQSEPVAVVEETKAEKEARAALESEKEKERIKIVAEMNEKSKEFESYVLYSLDPYNSRTLQLNAYNSTMTPESYGGWTTFPDIHGYGLEALKKAGFNAIRVFTSLSKTQYELRIINDEVIDAHPWNRLRGERGGGE